VIPLKDLNPTRRRPYLTVALLLACLGVYLVLQRPSGLERVDSPAGPITLPADLDLSLGWAAIPCEVVQGEPLSIGEIDATFNGGDQDACSDDASPPVYPGKQVYLAMVVSMFLHGGIAHLLGNLLFLWIFGNNVEDRLGPVGYAAFYLAGGVFATLAHVAVQPSSTVPVVGASGAISAVMGAYLIWYPKAPILTVVPPFLLIPIGARWFLGIWFVLQFFTNPSSGVAWVAHVAGFIFGSAFALLRRRSPPENGRSAGSAVHAE
jgi:membrane associated rhomboid family serine protease